MNIFGSVRLYRLYFRSIAIHNILSCYSWLDHMEHFSWSNIRVHQGHGRDATRTDPRHHQCLIMHQKSSRIPSSDRCNKWGTIDWLIGRIFSRLIDYEAVAWAIHLSAIPRLICLRHRRVAARLISARRVHGCRTIGTTTTRVGSRNHTA
jgi:hypothetical protein